MLRRCSAPSSSTSTHRPAPVCVWLETWRVCKRRGRLLVTRVVGWILRQHERQHICLCCSRKLLRIQVDCIMIHLMALLRITISSAHWFCRSITLAQRRRRSAGCAESQPQVYTKTYHPFVFGARCCFMHHTISVFSSTFYSVQSELSAPCKKLDEWLAAVPLLHHIPLLKH
jgi:hypothetical protein